MEAEQAGLVGSNGLSMLVFQAAKALEIWTEHEISADAMTQAAKEHFAR